MFMSGTIFAYGQTASGKTYTMMGEADTAGVIPLALRELFGAISRVSLYIAVACISRGTSVSVSNELLSNYILPALKSRLLSLFI